MISHIVIKNFAIIDHLDIELDEGMTALTGETGAGKSILLNALQLVLGDRADSDTVKTGCDKAEVIVSFQVKQASSAYQWLVDHDLDDDNDVIIRRVIQQNGRSKAYINGSPAPLAQLKALGSLLVDLHGQHEHQSLQKPAIQLQLLDTSLADPSLLNAVADAYSKWQSEHKKLKALIEGQSSKQQRVDLLTLYTQELNTLALKHNELSELEAEHKKLSSADELIRGNSEVVNLLYEQENSIFSQLNHCQSIMSQLSNLDSELNNTAEMIQSASIQAQEAATEINHYLDHIEHDSGRLNWLDERIAMAYQLANKHHIDASELPELSEQYNLELEQLNNSENSIEEQQTLADASKQDYLQQAKTLHQQRVSAGETLSQKITAAMQELGMQGGKFAIRIEASSQESDFNNKGFDQVTFEISANPGQTLKPLTRIASGGELSRMSLAIQVILAENSDIDTMIFDEVDSGIGGGIAEIVGQKLRLIALTRQVINVTHLPQVAAQAHQHFLVSKHKTDSHTQTQINELNSEQKHDEIARMLGGVTITEQTKAHAAEMIASVQ